MMLSSQMVVRNMTLDQPVMPTRSTRGIASFALTVATHSEPARHLPTSAVLRYCAPDHPAHVERNLRRAASMLKGIMPRSEALPAAVLRRNVG